MLILIALLTGVAVLSLTMLLLQSNANSTALAQLDELAPIGGSEDTLVRRRRQQRLDRMKSVLQTLGERVESGRKDTSQVRQFLLQAGYVDPSAVAIYWASRVILATGFVAGALFILPMLNVTAAQMLIAVVWLTFYIVIAFAAWAH